MINNFQLSDKLKLFAEYSVYLFIIFLFMDKGETLRTVGIFVPPLLIFIRAIILRENPVNFKNPIFILLICLCLSGIISSIFAPDTFYSLEWVKRTYFKLFLVFLTVVYLFQTPKMLEKLSKLFIFLAFLFTIFTFYDFYKEIVLYSNDFGKAVRKYIVPLEIFIPFILFYIAVQKTKYFKFVGFILLSISIVAIILTGSRGGWISVGVSILIWLIGYLYITRKRILHILPIIGVIIISVSLLLIILSPFYVKQKFNQLLTGDTSLRKEMVWPIALKSYANLSPINKIVGNGLGRMTYLEDYRKLYINKFGKEPEELYSPHNVYLYTLYKQGLLGLIIFITLLYISLKNLIRGLKINQSSSMKFFALSLISALIALMAHGMVEDTRFIQWMLMLPLIGAYIEYLGNIKND